MRLDRIADKALEGLVADLGVQIIFAEDLPGWSLVLEDLSPLPDPR
jgi:hypothetical protein